MVLRPVESENNVPLQIELVSEPAHRNDHEIFEVSLNDEIKDTIVVRRSLIAVTRTACGDEDWTLKAVEE